MSETNERLDGICQNISRVGVLNALHACRPGHPLNKGNNRCWQNAFAMVAQMGGYDIDRSDIDWLERKAQSEANGEISQIKECMSRLEDYPKGAMIRGDKIGDEVTLDQMVSLGLITSRMIGKKAPVRLVQLKA